MKIKCTQTKIATAVAAASMTCSFACLAQQPAALEEVTVTATMRAVSAQDIPYNITAMSGGALEDVGVSDVADLGKIIPGLSVTDSGARTGFISNGVVIRGLNGLDTSLMHSPVKVVSPVAQYIGNTPMYANVQLLDINRVEVLRGPQGTLYGSGSVGGTVRYLLNEPGLEETYGKITAGLGSTDGAGDLNTSVEGMFNLPVSDTFGLRFNVKQTREAGTVDYNNIYALDNTGAPALADPDDIVGSAAQSKSVKNADDGRSTSARVSALWHASDSTTVKFNYFRQQNESDANSAESFAWGEGSGESSKLILEPFEGETDMFSAEASVDMGFATLTSVSSYYDTSSEATFDLTGQYLGFSFYADYYGASPRPLIVDRSARDEDAFVQEIRLVSQTDGAVDWLAGLYYMKQKGETVTEQYFPGYHDYATACFAETGSEPGGVPCGFGTYFGDPGVAGTAAAVKDLAYLTNFQDEFEDRALYGEITWHATAALDVTGGIRVFDQQYELNEQGGLAFANLLSDSGNSLDANDELYKFNVSYRLNDDHQVYFTYSEGFRRGGANALGVLGNPAINTFIADTLDNLEMGIKGSFNQRIDYTLAYFDADWNDVQIRSNCTGLALICTVNAGDAVSRGLEVEVNAQLTESLQARMGYTYLDTEVTRANTDAGIAFEAGSELAGAPDNSANVTLIYSTDLSNDWILGAMFNVSYKGERAGNLPNTAVGEELVELEAYTLMDMAVSLSGIRWSGRLYVNNLTNDDTWISQADPALWQTGTYAGIQRPRTIGASVSYNF